jgi:transposase-like protein
MSKPTKAVQFWVEFDEELHCDYCMEVAHVHFKKECPVCKAAHAATNVYGMSLSTLLEEEEGQFQCDECQAKFKLLYESEYDFNWVIQCQDGRQEAEEQEWG